MPTVWPPGPMATFRESDDEQGYTTVTVLRAPACGFLPLPRGLNYAGGPRDSGAPRLTRVPAELAQQSWRFWPCYKSGCVPAPPTRNTLQPLHPREGRALSCCARWTEQEGPWSLQRD